MPAERASLQVEDEPASSSASRGGSPPVQKWQIAAAGAGIGILIIVIAVVLSGGKKADGGSTGGGTDGGTDGGDDVIIDVTPVEAKKIIWAYHDKPLTAFETLCKETIVNHTGPEHNSAFEFKLVSNDDLAQHISDGDLPTGWDTLKSQNKRDAAINALLARNGGVAMDLNTIMFHSLDNMWEEEIEKKKVAFKGFYYKSRSETATWFMMVGTEGTGIMQTALARQKKFSGDEPKGCMEEDRKAGICYGSTVVSYALCAYSEQYCHCYKSATEGCELPKIKSQEKPIEIVVSDPRKTVQSEIEKDTSPKVDMWQPMASTEDGTGEQAFVKFKERWNKGTALDLPFITMQAPTTKTGDLAGKSRADLLGDTASFLYQFLCYAGHTGTVEDDCGE